MHLLDLFIGVAIRGHHFFEDGWGDRAVCEASDPEVLLRRRTRPIDVQLGAGKRAHGALLYDGSFQSPEERLPECARTAHVKVLLPAGEVRGMFVHLAASGDQGFGLRLRFAEPLVARGVGAVVLENPYYGARRPKAQYAHQVRCVSDMHLMASATFLEGRSLLRWLRDELGFERVGVTGYSMGGQLAAMVGAAMPFPVAVVPVAPACSPDSVLREGVLRHVPSWQKLAAAGEDEAAVREALLGRASQFSVTSLPAPVYPEAAIVVGTSQDGFVPPSDMRRIAEHWGAELRWLPAGHVSALLRHQGAMRQAMLDALARLESAPLQRRRPRRASTGELAKAAPPAKAPAQVAGGAAPLGRRDRPRSAAMRHRRALKRRGSRG
ncbi:MAG TPA: alpha/beta hydrolase family protein [Anaeromyxobacter sp.]|nr:alpha/beta hydrolase family protein [Anaeromyxobacter sp.]